MGRKEEIKESYIIHPHPLRPTLIPQTLNRIHRLVRRPPSRVNKPKDVDHSDLRARRHAALRDRPVRPLNDIRGVQRRHDREQQHDQRGRDQQLRASAHFVGDEGAEDGAYELHHVLDPLEHELRVVACDSCAAEHLRVVVGDGAVAGPLAEEGYFR